ncbi:MAG TPA: hypothetical protein VJO34_13325 [Methylomirabilota bacterium]|nr:hypothetical protein [Methylomirabilota bacterium]
MARISRERIIGQLKLAARKGDRTALQLALGEMRTLAYSPKYWTRYLALLSHPMARLVDLLVLKQGDLIRKQKGLTKPISQSLQSASRIRRRGSPKPARRRRTPVASPLQPSLFPELDHAALSPRTPRKKRAG